MKSAEEWLEEFDRVTEGSDFEDISCYKYESLMALVKEIQDEAYEEGKELMRDDFVDYED